MTSIYEVFPLRLSLWWRTLRAVTVSAIERIFLMSGKQAKKLRRQIYGAEFSPRHRSYARAVVGSMPAPWIVADERRQAYQRAKGRRGR